MTKIFKNKLAILKEFIDICNEHSLWYSLDNESLLALVNDLDFWEKTDHYEVIMTFESYEKLRELYPNKILDSVKHSDYYSLQNKFVENINNIYEDCPFIDINLIIPTSIEKIRKFYKHKNKSISYHQFFASINYTNIPKIKNKIFLSKIIKNFKSSLNYKDFINQLHDDNYEGFIVTSPLINKVFLTKWLTNTNYNLRIFEKDGLKINVINEYQSYLKNIFGSEWKKIRNLDLKYDFISCTGIIKHEEFKEME
ncbi:hypothetical protein AB8O52_00135 [Mycoplasmopsis arginini]|uniref:hypothetical protein n=1 Tax=Mycoplasmopsis arginini TaxID=2094 RepID=UPI003513C041